MAGKKASDREIIKRRKKVFQARLFGTSAHKIAETLEVSVDTIYDDLEWWRKHCEDRIDNFNVKEDIGLFMQEMDEIKAMLFSQYVLTKDVSTRAGILIKAGELNEKIAKIKIVLGIWTPQVKPPIADKTFETLIVDSRKERGLLPEPVETITEKKINMAKIEKKEEESTIAKKIREMKNKNSKGGDKK